MKQLRTIVEDPRRPMPYLIPLDEASLSRIWQNVQYHPMGIISASRSEHPDDLNAYNHEELKRKVREAGYGFIEAHGGYTENANDPDPTKHRQVRERSLIVTGPKGHDDGKFEAFLRQVGEHYNQDSIIHKPGDSKRAILIGTSHRPTAFPSYGQKEDSGDWHPDRLGQYFTAMRRNIGAKAGRRPMNFVFAHVKSDGKVQDENNPNFAAKPTPPYPRQKDEVDLPKWKPKKEKVNESVEQPITVEMKLYSPRSFFSRGGVFVP